MLGVNVKWGVDVRRWARVALNTLHSSSWIKGGPNRGPFASTGLYRTFTLSPSMLPRPPVAHSLTWPGLLVGPPPAYATRQQRIEQERHLPFCKSAMLDGVLTFFPLPRLSAGHTSMILAFNVVPFHRDPDEFIDYHVADAVFEGPYSTHNNQGRFGTRQEARGVRFQLDG